MTPSPHKDYESSDLWGETRNLSSPYPDPPMLGIFITKKKTINSTYNCEITKNGPFVLQNSNGIFKYKIIAVHKIFNTNVTILKIHPKTGVISAVNAEFIDREDMDNITFKVRNIYRPKQSFGQVIFSQASVIHSVHRGRVSGPGGCLIWGVSGPGGVFSRGCLIRGCLIWGVSNFSGGVSGRGCVWSRGGVSNFWGGVWSGGGCLVPGGGFFTGIRSTFGRYASYWNAFLSCM